MQNESEFSEWSKNMALIGERSQEIVSRFMHHHARTLGRDDSGSAAAPGFTNLDPLSIGSAFMDFSQAMMRNPADLAQAQTRLWSDYMNLWQQSTRRLWGMEAEPVIAPEADDRRFKSDAWNDNVFFDFIKQSYLLSARSLQETVNDVSGVDEKTARKVDFYTRQFADAMSPTNFWATNPDVLQETLKSRGENLVSGLQNLLDDIERGEGQLRISMTDKSAFSLGENVATAKGKAVYRNDLIELLQYSPTTDQVWKRPLLLIPPWINKFYILDLSEKNSLIQWLVGQGFTVFCISWVNPDEKLAHKTFDDYMLEGPLDAIKAIEAATGEREVSVVGYCLGGTLLACLASYLTSKGEADRLANITFFTALVDFAEPGDLGVFIDDEQLEVLDSELAKRGYLEGSQMATTFNMLRSNDLIWSFVINNYLMGKQPFPFDLLYWNSDSTRMPAAMHGFYLRKMYLENKLIEPGGITLADTPIDLTQVNIPAFLLSCREDHIAPWKSTYAAVNQYKGPTKFVLAGSGHIAGVINPPNPKKPKYGYWTNPANPADPDQWLEEATQSPGSWWPEWVRWLQALNDEKVAARNPGDGKLPVLCDAPGEYVKIRA